MRQTVGILGTPIDILGTDAVLARLEQFIQERRFHQVATANTDFLINALNDPELRYILRNADLVVPDGMPVVWAAQLLGSQLPERVTGADIVPELAKLAAAKGYRIFMLGARPEVAKMARLRLEVDYPGLQIVGCVSPQASALVAMDSEPILEEINRARPDILLVAFGNPKQEKWIHLHRERLRDVPVCIGVGGTFDFLAGQTPRAPAWMQRNGLEWVFRLLQEPRRLWKRYIRDLLQFTSCMVRQWWGVSRGTATGHSEIYLADTGDCTVLSVVGDLDTAVLPRFQDTAEQIFDAGKNLILDFHSVTMFDGEALGTLLNLPKRAAYRGCEVRMVCVPPKIIRAMRRSQIQEGLYTVYHSVAQAFTNGRVAGLCWHIQCGAKAAVVTLNGGGADAETIARLESACARLLAYGKRVDLDAQGVTYVDSALFAMLHRLTRLGRNETSGESCFRVVPGVTMREALRREKLLANFMLREAPELPPDAMTYALVDDVEDKPKPEPVAART